MRHKFLGDFDIQMDHLISPRRSDRVIINKKKENLPKSELCRSGWPQGKSERKQKRDKCKTLLENKKKTMEHESGGDTNCHWCSRAVTNWLVQGLKNLEIRRLVETIQRSAWILRRVLETWGDLLSLRFQWKTLSAKDVMKNSQKR